MTTYTIHVLQEDINDGKPEDCGKCPIARAALRAFPSARWVSVTGDIEVMFEQGRLQVWSMPDIALSFMDTFDHGYEVTPFTFTAQFMEEF